VQVGLWNKLPKLADIMHIKVMQPATWIRSILITGSSSIPLPLALTAYLIHLLQSFPVHSKIAKRSRFKMPNDDFNALM
jgi:hypothetical protein